MVSLLPGCGSDAPEMVPVSGKVTLEGGSWPKEGTLHFAPQKPAEGFGRLPGSAEFDKEGNFRVKGDGLVPGTYGVRVECWKVPPREDNPSVAESYVAAKYQNPSTSGLTLTIEPGERAKEGVTFNVEGAD